MTVKDPKTIAGLVNEGRFSYPYIPTGIYAEIRNLSNLRIQTQEEITRIKQDGPLVQHLFSGDQRRLQESDAVSGLMVIKQAPLPCDIKGLGVDGVNKIWRDARLKGAGLKEGNDPGNSSGAQHWKYGKHQEVPGKRSETC